ncbi:hypothetical protein QCA50_001448 [Cerrena zonata]|uniref:Uncharacterized protein n=1 Tax=Cerrena zonata TaxID=2478898 RepID=A0AAW0GLN9_9APHY
MSDSYSRGSVTKEVPTLNYDILLYILRCLDNRADVSRMMRVHPILYRAGWSVLLGFPIELHRYNYYNILKILSLSGGIDRCAHIRTLAVNSHSLNDNDIWLITGILENSTKVRRLGIEDDDSDTLLSSDDFVEAVVNLSTLRDLRIKSKYDLLCNVLQRIKAPLVVLNISVSSSYKYELVQLIKNFCATLEVLRTCDVQIRDLDFQCPRVHLLSLRNLRNVGFISTRKLTKAFPNLRKLSFHDALGSPKEQEAEEYHSLNQEQPAHSPWTKLDYISASATNIWTLALQCPISSLRIVPSETGWHRMLQRINHDYSPAVMEIHLASYNMHMLTHLGKLFETNVPWTQLRVTINISNIRPESDSEMFWDKLRMEWTKLHVPYLELAFLSWKVPPGKVYKAWLSHGGPETDQMARDLYTSIPALHQVYIHFGTQETEKLWKFSRSDNGEQGPVLIDLPLSERPTTWIDSESLRTLPWASQGGMLQ